MLDTISRAEFQNLSSKKVITFILVPYSRPFTPKNRRSFRGRSVSSALSFKLSSYRYRRNSLFKTELKSCPFKTNNSHVKEDFHRFIGCSSFKTLLLQNYAAMVENILVNEDSLLTLNMYIFQTFDLFLRKISAQNDITNLKRYS